MASIAKPWLSEVDISKGQLESLKHELTHVLLQQIGVFPFYASWATGITEGAAMSVEPEYDGIYTLDEHAADILQLRYANGGSQIMSFSGFAAGASEESYVLAGSFARFLLKTYGPAAFDRVYASLDWKKEYGKPLDSLQSEWEQWLVRFRTPMEASDSTHFRYYYDRTAIIFQPCLRRTGKLERRAANAFEAMQYHDAALLYRKAILANGGIEALAGLSGALLRERKLSAAIQVLDTTHSPLIAKEIAALDERRADLRAIASDSMAADSFYFRALSAKLSSSVFLSAYAHRVLLHSAVRKYWLQFLKQEYMPDSSAADSATLFESFLQVWMRHHPQPGFDSTDLVLRYLYASLLEQRESFSGASRSDPFGIPDGPLRTLDTTTVSKHDSLAISLIALHFAGVEEENARTEYDVKLALRYVPQKYRAAVAEMAEELLAEAAFTTGEARAPETSR